MLVEEEDRVVTHLGAEAKSRVAQLGGLGTGKAPPLGSRVHRYLHQIFPQWLCHYSQG